MAIHDKISSFIQQHVYFRLKPNLSNISHDNLDLASSQLWSILQPRISYLPENDQKVVELAFTQMVIAHDQARRKSGEFYIIHPVAACLILAEIPLDKDTLAAALLHDVPEDTPVTLKDLAKDFSSEIVFLIEGVTKLSIIKYQGEDRYAENLRRMFVAMSQDLRVIFIKLADRLHNLQTLKHVQPEKQRRIALESLEIYAPIAERLGMNFFRGEIEDAAFPYVYPEEYKRILAISEFEIQKRTKQLEKIIKKTDRILKENQVSNFQLFGRAKKYFSIYKKINEKNKPIDEVHDLVALRVVTDTVANCYNIMSILNQCFTVDEARFKDYITQPKLNGYQSLHITATDPATNLTFEFQIRTQEMHEYAEYGYAAHWAYKEGKQEENIRFLDAKNLQWMNELIDLGRQKLTEEEYLKHVKLDLFQDRIFVLTPKGDVIDLPKGATPLDFAFKIHKDIGLHATMALVNGDICKLNEPLTNGSQIEILTDKRKWPNSDSLNWVKTHQATKNIRSYLRKKTEEESTKKTW